MYTDTFSKGMEGVEYNLEPQWNTFVTTNIYNERGALLEIRDTDGHTWWQADAADYDEHGRVTQYQYGNGLITTNEYNPLTDRLESSVIRNTQTVLSAYQFGYDRLGNLTSRSHERPFITTLSETCTYDSLNRLVSTINAATNTTTLYNSLGNITVRSDVGTYLYSSKPHAVSSVTSASSAVNYSYDSNGNILTRTRDSVQEFEAEWTSFNKPSRIVSGPNVSEFAYSVDSRRTRQLIIDGSNVVKKVYATPAYEMREILSNPTETNRANWQWEMDFCRIYVDTPVGKVGVYNQEGFTNGVGNVTRSYLHKDHLGSIVAVSDETGTNVTFISFDAWGNRRDPADWTPLSQSEIGNLQSAMPTDRGFTGHEQLDHLQLVHMNGRIYDPAIGRMISPDPFIQSPDNLQSFNRYSYVWNNPLSKTDPSGFLTDDEDNEITGKNVPSEKMASVRSESLSEQSDNSTETDTTTYTDRGGNTVSHDKGFSSERDGNSGHLKDTSDTGVEASDASPNNHNSPFVENANNNDYAPQSALGDLLGKVPYFGGLLGQIGDTISGVGNMALGAATFGMFDSFGRGFDQFSGGLWNTFTIAVTDNLFGTSEELATMNWWPLSWMAYNHVGGKRVNGGDGGQDGLPPDKVGLGKGMNKLDKGWMFGGAAQHDKRFAIRSILEKSLMQKIAGSGPARTVYDGMLAVDSVTSVVPTFGFGPDAAPVLPALMTGAGITIAAPLHAVGIDL